MKSPALLLALFLTVVPALASMSAPRLPRTRPVAPPAPAKTQPAAAPFSDVPKGHWAYQAVETLRKAGIIVGEPGGKFSHEPSKQ